MKFLLLLLITSTLYAGSYPGVLIMVNLDKDPELGGLFAEELEVQLSQVDSISLIPRSEVEKFEKVEHINIESDTKKVIEYLNLNNKESYIIKAWLNEYTVTKERHGIILINGQQVFSQSARIVLENEKGNIIYNNTLYADTTVHTGYCGFFSCEQKALAAEEQISIHTNILRNLNTQIIAVINQSIPF